MQTTEIIKTLRSLYKNNKGQIITLSTKREAKKRTLFKNYQIEKESTYQARVGVKYGNQKAVQAAKKEGMSNNTNKNLNSLGDNISVHKLTGRMYVGLASIKNNRSIRRHRFLFNGDIMDDSAVSDVLLSEETKDRVGKRLWLTVPLDTITSITHSQAPKG